ncbi:MAG TPA: ring-cleaving dioxygenase [Salinimicrobium sp.]|nr:ring-cleaving dioxygenase [Salinimicrobium sp.]
MEKLITGIHHVTALAGEPQRNLDFYTGVLGLRLVKKTVNFDAPDVYHFYYADEVGNPGSIMTFFPYEGIRRGRKGKGMLNVTAFSAPLASVDYWKSRFEKFMIPYQSEKENFQNEKSIYFEDPDGLGLEIIFTDKDNRNGFTYGAIPQEHSIKGFYSVEIWAETLEKTAEVLKVLDHQLIEEKDNRFRFAPSDAPGNYVDILITPDKLNGLGGGGTIHHLAFNTANRETQLRVREKISSIGLGPTPVLDRQYFESIYFREPGGVLFEVATSVPGFAVDEAPDKLGEALKLPPQYENRRNLIEQAVKPVSLNIEKFK